MMTATMTTRSASAARTVPLVKRRTSPTTPLDRLAALGCAVSATLLSWFVMHVLLDSPGWLADLIVAYLLYLGMLFLVTKHRVGRLAATDKVVSTIVVTGALGLLVP
jgi:phosphate transport system permease protein